jgi:TIR domain
VATIKEYFETDQKHGAYQLDWCIKKSDNSSSFSVTAKIYLDLEGNSKYWFFLLPPEMPLELVSLIFESPATASCVLSMTEPSAIMEMRWPNYPESLSSATLVFTRRIFLYVDAEVSDDIQNKIKEAGFQKGFFVEIRDRRFAKMRSELEKPLAFISHDSRDKDILARPLAREFARIMCPVWYDEFSLAVGDSLREKIERGLKEAQKCIVILSPHFLANGGWGKAEFDSLFTREILEKKNVILPVWHNVGVHEVYNYSPKLADKVGLSSSLGIEQLAAKLASAIRKTDA